MVDGSTEITDFELTQSNRTTVETFLDDVMIGSRPEDLGRYVDPMRYAEHGPDLDLAGKSVAMRYDRVHRILAEGNFVLSVCEGAARDVHAALYDLFRLANGRIVEHWDTVEGIPPRIEWKNDNGKF
jgi:predicted SnoaL-like aldol condensation-catalyzing enzyme